MRTRRAVILGLGGAAGALSFTLGLGWWQSRERAQPGAGLLPLPIDEMSFTLTDHHSEPVQPADWIGRPTLVFFGFTWCPDVCPTMLSNISGWLEDLGPDADRLNTVLISVDPERDTPEVLADYLSNFDPRITGLTGTLTEVERAAAGFRARFEKAPRDGDYTMNHTAGVFLFRADGRFGGIIDYHDDSRFALPKIRRVLD
ncbi:MULTISPECIES: SCO family protein [Paracoccaceae]|uniref:Electron transport protein SCO1/SenC n=1 Tax=Haematobacter missouriensis TaxID=366616 RepID=A0A212AHM8_9RHOB|nr:MULTISPECIES: SCO family protein [Paracoccaceae]OWJ80925.1 electron transport protein SCO1/SenC [Haematobacter missouriensis]